jgi:hypothetical protein
VVEELDEWSTVMAAPPAPVFQPPPQEELPEPERTRDLRWVPSAVVASLGSVAIAMIVLFYSSQHSQLESEPVASTAKPLELPAKATPTQVAEPVPVPAVEPQAFARTEPAMVEALPAPAVRPLPAPVPTPPVIPATSRPIPKVAATAPVASVPRSMPVAPPAARPKQPRTSAQTVAVAELAVAVATPPDASPQVVEAARIETPKPGSRDANRLLGQLSQAYEDGDLQGMRALFAQDARGPTGDLNSILAEYRRIFAASSERSLAMRDVSCFLTGDTFTIVASFEAVVTSGRGARKTRGDLRLDLRREGDRWQIFRMQHGDRPG